MESPGRGEGGSGTAWRVSVESPGRGEGGSGTAWRVSVESQGRGEGGSGTAWRVINSEEMLQEVMVSSDYKSQLFLTADWIRGFLYIHIRVYYIWLNSALSMPALVDEQTAMCIIMVLCVGRKSLKRILVRFLKNQNMQTERGC